MKHQNWTTVILFPRDLAIEIQALICDQKPFFHRLFCPIQCTIQRVFTQKVVIHPQLLLFSRWYRVFPLVNPLKARLFIFMCFSVLLITAVNICSNIKKKFNSFIASWIFPILGKQRVMNLRLQVPGMQFSEESSRIQHGLPSKYCFLWQLEMSAPGYQSLNCEMGTQKTGDVSAVLGDVHH